MIQPLGTPEIHYGVVKFSVSKQTTNNVS